MRRETFLKGRSRGNHRDRGGTVARPSISLPGGAASRRWLAVVAGLWLLLAVMYPGAMFRGEIFASADAANSDAFRLVGDQALAGGHYPLWNPYLFAGMPSFGSLAYVRFLYPPSLVLDTLQQQAGFAPLTWLLAHLLFGGLGMAWLLSRWRLPLPLLLLGGGLWIMMPKVVAWTVHGHGSKLGAAMYLPWLVGWVLHVLEGRGSRAVGMVGLLLGFQLLRGHVQITYYTLLLVGWLALWNAVWPLEEALRAVPAVRWRRLGLVLAGLAVGFAIGAMLLVPVQDYASLSIRGQDTAGGGGVGLDYATGWSLAPAELGTLVLPAAAGFGKATYLGLMPFNDYPNYLGFLLLVLALAGWWAGNRSLVVALAVMAVLAVFVAFGKYGFGLYEFLYGVLPYFNKFRIPSMVMVLVGFAVALLAVRGIAAWREGKVPCGRPLVLPAVLGLIGVVLLLGGATGMARSGYEAGLTSLAESAGRTAAKVLLEEAWNLHRASLVRSGLLLLVAASALWFSSKHANFRQHGLAWVLLGILALDLAQVDRLIIHPERGLLTVARDGSGGARLVPASKLTRKPPRRRDTGISPADRALRDAVGHERIWPLAGLGGSNAWMVHGIRSVGGYHPAKLAGYEQVRRRLYGERPAGRLANWLGVSQVVYDSPFNAAEFEFLDETGLALDRQPGGGTGTVFYANGAALPRARWAGSWQPNAALPGGGALEPFLDALQAGTRDPRTVALDPAPEPEPAAAQEPLPPPVFVLDGTDEVVLTTSAPVDAVLVLADMNTRGWQVEVDGRPATLLTADLLLRGVAVPAGNHEVRFVYRDPAVGRGLAVSVTGLLVAMGLILFPGLRRRWAARSIGAQP